MSWGRGVTGEAQAVVILILDSSPHRENVVFPSSLRPIPFERLQQSRRWQSTKCDKRLDFLLVPPRPPPSYSVHHLSIVTLSPTNSCLRVQKKSLAHNHVEYRVRGHPATKGGRWRENYCPSPQAYSSSRTSQTNTKPSSDTRLESRSYCIILSRHCSKVGKSLFPPAGCHAYILQYTHDTVGSSPLISLGQGLVLCLAGSLEEAFWRFDGHNTTVVESYNGHSHW